MATAVLAGLLIGFAATTFAYRHGMLKVPGGHGFVDRLNRELKLSPDQLHGIVDLVHNTRSRMDELHLEYHRQRHQLILQTHDQIRSLLTPEQQREFDRSFKPPPNDGHEHHDGGD